MNEKKWTRREATRNRRRKNEKEAEVLHQKTAKKWSRNIPSQNTTEEAIHQIRKRGKARKKGKEKKNEKRRKFRDSDQSDSESGKVYEEEERGHSRDSKKMYKHSETYGHSSKKDGDTRQSRHAKEHRNVGKGRHYGETRSHSTNRDKERHLCEGSEKEATKHRGSEKDRHRTQTYRR